jgi:hypothetical protein
MPSESGRDTELTPEAVAVLKDIAGETQKLRKIDLGDTPPANVFLADSINDRH